VTSFPSADQARAFFNTSANKWRSCSGQTVTTNGTVRWIVGEFVGDATKIALTITVGDAPLFQRVLSVVSNLVIDVMTGGYHLTSEGNQIADQIATKATH
jgi:serine/threonine-protein kinase